MARPSFEEACRIYTSRYTLEHIPEWASRHDGSGAYYAPAYRSDQEWYDRSTFPGEGKHGDAKRFCISTGQTWPLGNRLNDKQSRELLNYFKENPNATLWLHAPAG